jgi:signal transduction histidine kinase
MVNNLCATATEPIDTGRTLICARLQYFLFESFWRKDAIMKLMLTATALAVAMAAGNAAANEPTEKDAVALVEKGVAYMKEHGKDAIVKAINEKDPQFYQGSLYLFMRDAKTAVMLAHPVNPALIGKDLADVPDVNGKKYRREEIEVAATKGKGWVDYAYKNPATGKIEPKNTYLVKVGDVMLEAGVYKK